MANVAYVRVSSAGQSYQRQLEELEKRNINLDKIFHEKISAKDTNRPALKEMLNYLREGDTLYITEFSRLARSTVDLLSLVQEFNNKNIKFVSLKENMDFSSAHGNLMLTMLGAISEFERAIIKDRQKQGIDAALKTGKTKTGKPFGRPKHELTEERKEIIQKWIDKELNLKEAVSALGVSQRVAYTLKDEYLGKK